VLIISTLHVFVLINWSTTHAHFTFYVHVSNLTTTIKSTCSTSESTKTGHSIMQYWKTIFGEGAQPPPQAPPRCKGPHTPPLGACGASILAPASLDRRLVAPNWNFWIRTCMVLSKVVNEVHVESRYLQEKVTSLQVESTVCKFTLIVENRYQKNLLK